MPQLNVAPSPSPVIAPPASGNAASADTAAAAADGASVKPFAAMLQHQVNQQAAGKQAADKADKSSSAAAAMPAAPEKTDATADTPTADVLAAIAQMLPGIVPPKPVQSGAQDDLPAGGAKAKGKQAAADDGAGPIALTAPVLPALPPNTVATAAPPATETADTAPAGALKPGATPGFAATAAENLAADAQGTASRAAPAKEEASDFASLLAAAPHAGAAAPANVHATAGAAPNAVHDVQTPVGAQGWSNEVGEKLTWMVGKHETRAELVLNPPELGRIEVSITVKGDQASASFVSANPTVRDAIENAVPRLREILQDAGISLGQTQVGAESFQQQQSAANRENGDNSQRGGNADAAGADPIHGGVSSGNATSAVRRGNGLVDTFA